MGEVVCRMLVIKKTNNEKTNKANVCLNVLPRFVIPKISATPLLFDLF